MNSCKKNGCCCCCCPAQGNVKVRNENQIQPNSIHNNEKVDKNVLSIALK